MAAARRALADELGDEMHGHHRGTVSMECILLEKDLTVEPRTRAPSMEEIPCDLWAQGADEEAVEDEGDTDTPPRLRKTLTGSTSRGARKVVGKLPSLQPLSKLKTQRLPPRSGSVAAAGPGSKSAGHDGMMSALKANGSAKLKFSKSNSAIETMKRAIGSLTKGKGSDGTSVPRSSTNLVTDTLEELELPRVPQSKTASAGDDWNAAPLSQSMSFLRFDRASSQNGAAPRKRTTGPGKEKALKDTSPAALLADLKATRSERVQKVAAPSVGTGGSSALAAELAAELGDLEDDDELFGLPMRNGQPIRGSKSRDDESEDDWNNCSVAISMPMGDAQAPKKPLLPGKIGESDDAEFPGFSAFSETNKGQSESLTGVLSSSELGIPKPYTRTRNRLKSLPEPLLDDSPGQSSNSPSSKSPIPVAQVKFLSSFAEHRRRVAEAEQRELAEQAEDEGIAVWEANDDECCEDEAEECEGMKRSHTSTVGRNRGGGGGEAEFAWVGRPRQSGSRRRSMDGGRSMDEMMAEEIKAGLYVDLS